MTQSKKARPLQKSLRTTRKINTITSDSTSESSKLPSRRKIQREAADLAKVRIQAINEKSGKRGGGGLFDRASSSPIMIFTTKVTENLSLLPTETKDLVLPSSQNLPLPHFDDEARTLSEDKHDSKEEKIESSFESPESHLKAKYRNRDDFRSPTGARIIDSTPGGSRGKVETPGGTVFVRCFKVFIEKQNPTSGKSDILRCDFFQTEKSAVDNKVVKHISLKDKDKIVKKTKPLPSKHWGMHVEVASENLGSSGQRHNSHKESASAMCQALTGMVVPCEHSHAMQHSLIDAFLKAISSDNAKAQGMESVSFITLPSTRDANTARLVSVEIPQMKLFINYKGSLFYTNKITVFENDKGPIPLVKDETVRWEDAEKNSITVQFDVWNGVKPAKQLASFMYETMKVPFGSPPKNEDKKPPKSRAKKALFSDSSEIKAPEADRPAKEVVTLKTKRSLFSEQIASSENTPSHSKRHKPR